MSNILQGKWRLGLLLSGLLVVLIVGGVFVFNTVTTPQAHASNALFPATASPGSTILVTGNGYSPQEHLKVYFQTPDRGILNALTNAQGTFSVFLTVPSTYVPGTSYYVHVNSDTYSTQLLFNFARINIALTDPSIAPSFGAQTPFMATGFKPDEQVKLVWSNGTSILSAGTVQAGSDGSFNTVLTMPSFSHATAYKLVATGVSSGFTTNMPITEAPGIVYDPTSAPAGTTVNVKGGAFGSSELVNVSFMGSSVAVAKTDKNGAFATSFTVTESDAIGYQDNAIVATGESSREKAEGGFDREPTIDVDPNHGTAGSRVDITGKHFTPKGEVRIYLISDKEHESRVDRCLLADIHASGKGGNNNWEETNGGGNGGTFSIVVTIPNGDCLEDNSHIVAIDVKTGDKAVVPFYGEDNDEGHED